MVKNKPRTIDEIFSKIDVEEKDIVERFRFLIKSALPKVEEVVKRGKFAYKFGGKDFLAIRIAKAHVDLLFLHGTRLASPLLKGTGKLGEPRHIEVVNLREFGSCETEVIRLLKEAAIITTVL